MKMIGYLKSSTRLMEILQAPEMFAMEKVFIMISSISSLLWRPLLHCPLMIIHETPEMFAMEKVFVMIAPLFSRSSSS